MLLCREGWRVNHKRVYRIYGEEGLGMRRKPPKRRRACLKRKLRPLALEKNECCANLSDYEVWCIISDVSCLREWWRGTALYEYWVGAAEGVGLVIRSRCHECDEDRVG